MKNVKLLKKLLEENKKTHIHQLIHVFYAFDSLDGFYIIEALLRKLENDLENGDIAEHMKSDAKEAFDILNKLNYEWSN